MLLYAWNELPCFSALPKLPVFKFQILTPSRRLMHPSSFELSVLEKKNVHWYSEYTVLDYEIIYIKKQVASLFV